MKPYILLTLLAAIAYSVPTAPQAYALSCLPVADYLENIVGNGDVVIFEATSLARTEETGYTAEVLKINEAKQGYVENEIFAYHQKDETWGYLCNAGPKAVGTTGVYVANRDTTGKYLVTQRLESADALVATLEEKLVAAESTGTVTEPSKTDRMNQIITTITELVREIGLLLKEYAYWNIQ